MPINTENPIFDLQLAILEVNRQFASLLKLWYGTEKTEDPMSRQSDEAILLRREISGLHSFFRSSMQRLVEHGKLTEADADYVESCKSLDIEAMPEELQPAWTTLLGEFEKIVPATNKAYEARGVERPELLGDADATRAWYLLHELTSPPDDSEAGSQAYLSRGLKCDGSLLRLPVESTKAPTEKPGQLTLGRYVEEIRGLRHDELPIDIESVKRHLSLSESALADSISNAGNPSLITAETYRMRSSRERPFGTGTHSIILVFPMEEDDMQKPGTVLVKPRGVSMESFDVPIRTTSSSGSAPTVQSSESGVNPPALRDSKHMVFGEPEDWEEAVRVIGPTLESISKSLQE